MDKEKPRQLWGRAQELARLESWLVEKPRLPVLVTGLPGTGKSALVSEFLRLHAAPNKILRLNVGAFSDIYDGPGRFLNQIKPTAPDFILIEEAELIPPPIVSTIFARLRAAAPGVPIIVTSRYRDLPIDALRVDLPSLSSDEALQMLQAAGAEGSQTELRILAEKLNGHPLALTLVARLLTTGISIRSLIAQLDASLYDVSVQALATPLQASHVAGPQIVTATDHLIHALRAYPDDIYKLSSRQFEELVAQLMESSGWHVHLTPQTRDGGRDILAYLDTSIGKLLCLVETKKYRRDRPVGVELVRALYGTLIHEQANSALLVTTSYFSPEAKQFREQHVHQLSLKDYTDVLEWIKKYRR